MCELADRVLGDRVAVPWRQWADDYGLIRDAIERAIPGFEDFNARLVGRVHRCRSPPRDELRFTTPSGRARAHASTTSSPVAVP